MTILPADRCFWCIIDAPGVRGGPIPEGLWPLIEDDLPLNGDQLWAVAAPINGQRLAVCAVRSGDVEDHRGATTLTPQSVPDFIPAPPSYFNLLVGEYEPVSLRRVRTRRRLVAAACTLSAACLVSIGLSRRAGAWRAQADATTSAAQAMVTSVASKPVWTREDLALELLERRQAAPLSPPGDAAQALADLIARWPTQVPAKTQSISASGASASIAVTISGDAQEFLSAMRPPVGWVMDEPRLAAIDKATRLNLELRRMTP